MPYPASPYPFQSAPGGEAGGNWIRVVAAELQEGFNPPPAVRPGETRISTSSGGTGTVSIRPRR